MKRNGGTKNWNSPSGNREEESDMASGLPGHPSWENEPRKSTGVLHRVVLYPNSYFMHTQTSIPTKCQLGPEGENKMPKSATQCWGDPKHFSSITWNGEALNNGLFVASWPSPLVQIGSLSSDGACKFPEKCFESSTSTRSHLSKIQGLPRVEAGC